MQSKVNAINQFETTYGTPSTVVETTAPTAEINPTGQVIDSPMTVNSPAIILDSRGLITLLMDNHHSDDTEGNELSTKESFELPDGRTALFL